MVGNSKNLSLSRKIHNTESPKLTIHFGLFDDKDAEACNEQCAAAKKGSENPIFFLKSHNDKNKTPCRRGNCSQMTGERFASVLASLRLRFQQYGVPEGVFGGSGVGVSASGGGGSSVRGGGGSEG